jgi:hypothetical protein
MALQEAEQAVRAVLTETTRSPFPLDRRVTHRLESAITSINGALILLDTRGASVLRDDA